MIRLPPRVAVVLGAALAAVTASAQAPSVLRELTAASLSLIGDGEGGYYWLERRSDDTYAVYTEAFDPVAALPVAEDTLRAGTTVLALAPGFRLDEAQANFLVERTGEFVVQVIYGADGTVLRRTTRPRYTQTYPLTSGQVVVQQRDPVTGEEVLIDLATLDELGRFPERVVHTAVTGEDLWASRVPAAARVYDESFTARSEVVIEPARADPTPGYAFGLLVTDVGADGLLDFEIRFRENDEAARYRVFDERGTIYLDTVEPAGVTLAVAGGLDNVRPGDAVLAGYGLGLGYAFVPNDPADGRLIETTAPTAVRTSAGTFVAGPRSADLTGVALVYDGDYRLRNVVEPAYVAAQASDTSLSAFAYAAVGERGAAFAEAPLAWVSYGDPEDYFDTRYYLTDLEGELRFGFDAQALEVAESATAVYLVVDRGGPPRAREFVVYAAELPIGTTPVAGALPRADLLSLTPNPASSEVTIRARGEATTPLEVTLLTVAGQRVAPTTRVSSGQALRLPSLRPGSYLLAVRSGEGTPLGVLPLVVTSP